LMNKKGQFYIFIAILLVTYAFNIARPATLAVEKPDSFKELYSNFITESSVVVNNALYEGQNVSQAFGEFADNFAVYAVTKSPRFRFVYILKDQDKLVVANRLGVSINATFTDGSFNMNDGAVLTVNAQDVTIGVGEITYEFEASPNSYSVQSLFRQKTSTETRIFVNK